MSSTEATNWMVVVGFIVTIGVNLWVDIYKEDRSLNRAAVVEIKAASTDLQLLAFSYVAALTTEAGGSLEARQDLSKHIVRLNDILEHPDVRLTSEDTVAAEGFQSTLVTLQNEVLVVDDPSELGGFWIALRDVLAARNEFLMRIEGGGRKV